MKKYSVDGSDLQEGMYLLDEEMQPRRLSVVRRYGSFVALKFEDSEVTQVCRITDMFIKITVEDK